MIEPKELIAWKNEMDKSLASLGRIRFWIGFFWGFAVGVIVQALLMSVARQAEGGWVRYHATETLQDGHVTLDGEPSIWLDFASHARKRFRATVHSMTHSISSASSVIYVGNSWAFSLPAVSMRLDRLSVPADLRGTWYEQHVAPGRYDRHRGPSWLVEECAACVSQARASWQAGDVSKARRSLDVAVELGRYCVLLRDQSGDPELKTIVDWLLRWLRVLPAKYGLKSREPALLDAALGYADQTARLRKLQQQINGLIK